MAPGWTNLDFSWIIRLGRHERLCRGLRAAGLLSDPRWERIQHMDPGTIVWDLRRGIPFQDHTFDGVYHSHLLEHIDRASAPAFLRECRRVLKTGGVLRVVVPDLELLARRYLATVAAFPDRAGLQEHTRAVEEIFDQMIVRTPYVRGQQTALVRVAEAVLIGNTARAGTLHRWMYDEISLTALLRQAGFSEVQRCGAETSWIEGWSDFHLDAEPDGSMYKPESLYLEARNGPPLAQD